LTEKPLILEPTLFHRLRDFRFYGLAFAGGFLGAFAMAPVDFLPAMSAMLAMGVWGIDRSDSPRRAAFFGWWLGFGYFLSGLWWLGVAFFVDPGFVWLAPFGVLVLPAFLALFFAAGWALAFMLWTKGPSRLVVFALCLGASEELRGIILTGFPWNTIGMAFGDHLALAQLASVIGMNGLTFVALLLLPAPVLLLNAKDGILAKICFGVAGLFLCGMEMAGEWRLSQSEARFVPNVTLRLMQPDMPLDDRFSRQHAAEILHHYFELSTKGSYPSTEGMAGITHLIWPETSFPFLLDREAAARAEIAHILERGSVLLAGAVRAEGDGLLEDRRYFNAIQAVDAEGAVVASADKVHLVPFGEYLPFGDLLKALGLRQFVQAPGGFTAADHRSLMRVSGLPPLLPVICYEAIFPIDWLSENDERPGAILNVTNDAWFGLTPGPWQHFEQARLRAIELGLPLIRSANNGVSAIVDGYGRSVAFLPLGRSGVIDGPLPLALPPTIFARLPRLPFGALFSIGALCLMALTKRQLTVARDSPSFATADR
jgi:apolipoprotein N-acyltransferase